MINFKLKCSVLVLSLLAAYPISASYALLGEDREFKEVLTETQNIRTTIKNSNTDFTQMMEKLYQNDEQLRTIAMKPSMSN